MKKIKTTVFANEETELVNVATGELHEDDSRTTFKKITIEEFVDEDDSENENALEYFMTDTTFVRSFRGNGIMLRQCLNNSEIATLVFLNDFICYSDCVLRKNGNKNGSPLTIRDLSVLIDMKYDTLRKIMYSLKKQQVIAFHSSGVAGDGMELITLNPYIFCRGNKIERWIAEYYSSSKWATAPRQKTKS